VRRGGCGAAPAWTRLEEVRRQRQRPQIEGTAGGGAGKDAGASAGGERRWRGQRRRR
jgi:hypothetical protein